VGIGADITASGLANLAARARECGGQFALAPRAGGGSRLVWSAPLP
jgi:signal transduction histidine kinase